jgi:hypothetical protein
MFVMFGLERVTSNFISFISVLMTNGDSVVKFVERNSPRILWSIMILVLCALFSRKPAVNLDF